MFLGNLLIGLREGLEATLIVSILVTYLVRTRRRHQLTRLWLGVAAAAALSLAVGAALTFGPQGLSDETQELIGGAISIVAVGFVTWMVLWMAGASGALSESLKDRVDTASDHPLAISTIAFLAVGREGLETALFVWAATQSAGSGPLPLLGALAGIAIAAALGWLLYRGAVRIRLGPFFAVTGGFLVVVAAGVLAAGVHDLQEAQVLPGAETLAYDLTGTVDANSLGWVVLRGTLNIAPEASVLSVLAWAAYLVTVGALFLLRLGRARPASRVLADATKIA